MRCKPRPLSDAKSVLLSEMHALVGALYTLEGELPAGGNARTRRAVRDAERSLARAHLCLVAIDAEEGNGVRSPFGRAPLPRRRSSARSRVA